MFPTKWFTLMEKRVDYSDEPFYSIATRDYVTTVAVTENDEMLFVRQYRPAVEVYTLELPSGHVDENEEPAAAARRELVEETGYAAARVDLMGVLVPDTGRLENRMWCFHAAGVRATGAPPEDGIELERVPLRNVRDFIAAGTFTHALNLAALLLTLSRTETLRIF